MSSNKRRKVEKKSTTEKRMNEAYHILKVMSEKPDEDECSLYTELLCKKLRALNDNTREFAMYEINNLMYRLKQQQNKPSCSVASESNLARPSILTRQYLQNFNRLLILTRNRLLILTRNHLPILTHNYLQTFNRLLILTRNHLPILILNHH